MILWPSETTRWLCELFNQAFTQQFLERILVCHMVILNPLNHSQLLLIQLTKRWILGKTSDEMDEVVYFTTLKLIHRYLLVPKNPSKFRPGVVELPPVLRALKNWWLVCLCVCFHTKGIMILTHNFTWSRHMLSSKPPNSPSNNIPTDVEPYLRKIGIFDLQAAWG